MSTQQDVLSAQHSGHSELERQIEPAPLGQFEDSATAAAAERCAQTLWHVGRASSPPAMAVLSQTSRGDYELDIAIGEAARQRLTFGTPIPALEHAERVRTRLEGVGYGRIRRDSRLLEARSRQTAER